MSDRTYTMKLGDRPWLFYELDPKMDLSTATVTFTAKLNGGAVALNKVAAQVASGTYEIDGVSRVLAPADGVVFYPVGASDFAAAGTYDVEWIVTRSGLPETRPSYDYARLIIEPPLA